jgi:hypothetical protein
LESSLERTEGGKEKEKIKNERRGCKRMARRKGKSRRRKTE